MNRPTTKYFKELKNYKLSNQLKEYLLDNVKESGIVKMIQEYTFDPEDIKKDLIKAILKSLTKDKIKLILTNNSFNMTYFNTRSKNEIIKKLCNHIKIINVIITKDNYIFINCELFNQTFEFLVEPTNIKLQTEYESFLAILVVYKDNNVYNKIKTLINILN
jgi:hypothetical protein